MNKIFSWLITLYQRFLSVFSYGSCRYYPTCSQYAKIQMEKNSFFKAIYFTITRILKCNQLFEGGFDYPVIKCKFDKIVYKKVNVTYWYIPIKSKTDYYYVVKNRKWRV